MTEKEKMLSQLYYNVMDEELIKDREICKDLCFEYNNLRPSQVKEQDEIIRKLFASVGVNCSVTPYFWCDYGYNITVGDNFYINHNSVMLDCGKITFGDNVIIGPNCGFYTAGHPIDADERKKGLEYAYPITVGNDVWIGGGVQVMPGVTIGNNVVIGGGSVVVKDVPDNAVACGNPCRVVRFTE